MNQTARQHAGEIDRCNQRGGRMLSVVDLIEAGTLSPEMAAYSLAVIGKGASFMVGAIPGGAGKTTVMGSLLNLVPPEAWLAPADSLAAIERGLAEPRPRKCYICHEIGRGHYYAYLWGEALRAFFELPTAGHMIATNLHADTFEQARDQVRRDNGVSAGAFRRMNAVYFLALERDDRTVRRRIVDVWESDGREDHRRVFDDGRRVGESRLAARHDLTRATKTMDALLKSGARTVEDVRRFLLGDAER